VNESITLGNRCEKLDQLSALKYCTMSPDGPPLAIKPAVIQATAQPPQRRDTNPMITVLVFCISVTALLLSLARYPVFISVLVAAVAVFMVSLFRLCWRYNVLRVFLAFLCLTCSLHEACHKYGRLINILMFHVNRLLC